MQLSMTEFTRKSANEWEWSQGNKHHSVQVFMTTQRLIWSGWMKTSNGPVFDPGFTQPVQNFREVGVPEGYDPPDALIDEVRSALDAMPPADATQPERVGLFGRLRKLFS